MTDRHNQDGGAPVKICIDVPREVAQDLVNFLSRVVEELEAELEKRSRRQQSAQFDTQLKERAEHLKRVGVRAYREFRRRKPKGPERSKFFRELADHHQLNADTLEFLVSRRRKNVKNYVNQRRYATTNRLYRTGKSNSEIATALGLSNSSVQRYIRQIRRSGIPAPQPRPFRSEEV